MKKYIYTILFLSLFIHIPALSPAPLMAQTIRRTEIIMPPGIANNGTTFEVAVVNSTNLVYNSGNGFGTEISVFDPNTNQIVASILPAPANGFIGGGASVSRVNQTTGILYFYIQQNNSLVVVDGRPNSPTFNQTLPAVALPNQTISSFALDETRGRLYVATRITNSNPVQSQVQVIDANPASPTFHQTLRTAALPAGQSINSVAVNTNTNKIYAGTSSTGNGVYVINETTQTIAPIPGTLPTGNIIVNDVSNTIYAVRNGVASVQAIDGVTDALTTSIALPGNVGGFTGESVAINRQTERVFMSLINGSVSVVDAKRSSPTFNQALTNIVIPNAGSGEVAVDESTNKIVVGSFNLRTTIIDGATNTIAATTFGNLSSSDVAINSNTDRAFVAYQLSVLQIVNLTNNTHTNVALAADVGEGIINPANNFYYFGRVLTDTDLAYLDTTDNMQAIGGLPHNFGRFIFSGINTQTNRLYFVNSSSNLAGTQNTGANGFVSVVNGATNQVIANIEVGGQPFSNPAVNETTNKIYVLNAGFGNAPPSSISVINGATNTASAVNTSAFPANTQFLREATVNPTTNRIYFTTGTGTLGVINGATDVGTPVAGVTGVGFIRVNRNLNRVYVSSGSNLIVLNGADDSILATVPLSGPVFNLIVNETAGSVYVISGSTTASRTLWRIDGGTNAVVASVSVSGSCCSVALDETRNRLYLGDGDAVNETASRLIFVDGVSLAVRKILPLPLVPGRLRVNPATKSVYASTVNAAQRTGIVVVSDPTVSSVPFDFDGDGRADVSVFRASNGAWYLQQSTNGFAGLSFGQNADKIVPADYDGDGKTDVAVYRSGIWYLQRSQLGFTGIAFGDANDVPVPGDYDGDGKADVAVFRPSTGAWYLLRSSLGFAGTLFGQDGDKPVAADYDGDGKTDIGVFRGGTWYLQRSQLGFTGVTFGDAADKPVPADYDADGRADVAVFRPSNGAWYIQQTTAGFAGATFGVATDLPVPADYDGDGKADIGVFRNGTWYLQRSSAGFTGVTFGATGDKPVPGAFIP
jgi:YVTN family beta-propeller protein